MRNVFVRSVLPLLSFVSFAGACGDSDGEASVDASPPVDAATDARADDSARPSDAASEEDAGQAHLATMQCGTETCTGIRFLDAVDYLACCATATTCGRSTVNLSPYLAMPIPEDALCQPLDQPGTPTEACPVVDVGGIEVSGCCLPEGVCGLDTTNVVGEDLGLGCIDLRELGQEVTPTPCGEGNEAAQSPATTP